jgi:murein DD-endopeptidase MepM/ murein hydrolase activator NlpD
MRQLLTLTITVSFILILLNFVTGTASKKEAPTVPVDDPYETITGTIQSRETMELIFNKYNLSLTELADILLATEKQYNISRLEVGNAYVFKVDDNRKIQSMQYAIDDESFLHVSRLPEGFIAQKRAISYDRRIGSFYLLIGDSLVSSMPHANSEYLKVALMLSDIYAWDIDFSSEIRKGDSVKIILEELWAGGAFKGFGNILAAEIINNGRLLRAYRFDDGEGAGYFDGEGKSLHKTLLRSPLKFRYISSHFSNRRFHPILRKYRPHLGVDYAAPSGTPVSAAGGGTVLFAGYKGQNGKMVRIKHRSGYETYYGHLSKIPRKVRTGTKVSQGDIIGYVGSTGLSTGPHLDYRIKYKGRFVNPLKVVLPREESVPQPLLAQYRRLISSIDKRLALLGQPMLASTGKNGAATDDDS